MQDSPLMAEAMSHSLSVLIVEDEPLIAMILEDFLDGLGHRVAGTVDALADAVCQVEAGGFDVAVLDLHLRGGESAWPVADMLADRSIPFLVATGGNVDAPPRHVNVGRLFKPYTMDGVRQALEACIPAH